MDKRQKVPSASLSAWADLQNSMDMPRFRPEGITTDEVRQHNTESSCWTILNGMVYDITDYLHYHPGGKEKLMLGSGKDCTALFNKYHPWINIGFLLQKQCLGKLKVSAPSKFLSV